MCGIALLVSTGDGDGCAPHQPPSFRSLYPAIQRSNRLRGPDQSATVTLEVDRHDANTLALSLSSSVLGLRGSPLTSQPLQSQDARVLFAWNGQIFDWKQQVHAQPSSSKAKLDDGHNDGQLLFDAIQARLQHLERDDRALDSGAAAIEAVRATLADVEGPYAFVLLDKASGLLVYGRDPLGRRSLLLGHDPAQGMILASVSCLEAVAAGLEMQEVDCSALWSIALREPSMTPSRIERRSKLSEPLRLHELEDPSALEEQRFTPRSLHERLSSAAAFEAVLAESVRSRVTQIRSTGAADEAHLAILFSGGLDCATLARLADRFVPREQPIDLLNVGFENPRAIKSARLEAEKALKRAEKLRAQERRRKAKETGLPLHPSRAPGGADVDTEANAEAEAEAEAARVRGDPVAEADIYDVPDRLTGRATHAELVRLAPQRRWNFVEINVTYAEYCEARPTIEALMHPTASVMDLSLAAALYFASRGRGQVRNAATQQPEAYTTPARVLISGLGADELLGGYSRHRNAFNKHGWRGLVDELQLDLGRLATRNLGRDDRILSTHGREARYPFLARSVMAHLTALPVVHKTDPRLALGQGDKRLLRDVAASSSVGLVSAAAFKKRAMQFGTRAAKIEEGQGNVKGHQRLVP